MLCRDLSRKIIVDNRQVFSLFENLVEDQRWQLPEPINILKWAALVQQQRINDETKSGDQGGG